MTAKSGSKSFGGSRMNFRVRKTVAPCLALLLSVSASLVFAQSAEVDKSKLSPAERAQRDADKVFHWIKLNSSAPRQAAAPAPAPSPAPAPNRKLAQQQEAPAAAPSPIRETVTPVANAKPAGTTTNTATNAGATAAPAPAVAVAAQPAAASEALPDRTQLALAPEAATRSIAAPAAIPAPAPAKAATPEPELPLELVSRVEPDLPRQLLATLRNGSVHVRFEVQPDGSVKNAEAIKSNNKRLATAAVAAVAQWRFKPVPRAREATVELGFQIE